MEDHNLLPDPATESFFETLDRLLARRLIQFWATESPTYEQYVSQVARLVSSRASDIPPRAAVRAAALDVRRAKVLEELEDYLDRDEDADMDMIPSRLPRSAAPSPSPPPPSPHTELVTEQAPAVVPQLRLLSSLPSTAAAPTHRPPHASLTAAPAPAATTTNTPAAAITSASTSRPGGRGKEIDMSALWADMEELMAYKRGWEATFGKSEARKYKKLHEKFWGEKKEESRGGLVED